MYYCFNEKGPKLYQRDCCTKQSGEQMVHQYGVKMIMVSARERGSTFLTFGNLIL